MQGRVTRVAPVHAHDNRPVLQVPRPPHQQEVPRAGMQEHPPGEAPEGHLRRLPVPGRAEHRKIRPVLPDEAEDLDVSPSFGRDRFERDAPRGGLRRQRREVSVRYERHTPGNQVVVRRPQAIEPLLLPVALREARLHILKALPVHPGGIHMAAGAPAPAGGRGKGQGRFPRQVGTGRSVLPIHHAQTGEKSGTKGINASGTVGRGRNGGEKIRSRAAAGRCRCPG